MTNQHVRMGGARAVAAWLATAGVVAALAGCAPQPSVKPLGWGPLLPGMEAAPIATVARRAPPPAPKRHAAHDSHAEADSGAGSAVKVAEAKAGGESPKPGDPHPGEPKIKPTAAAFLGDYLGEDVATYRIESLPDRTEKDPKARLTVTSSSDTALAFELVDSSNGKEICTLNGTLTEAGASIAKGQKCFEQSGEDASTAATVLTGTASVDKARLVFDLDMSFAMEIADRKLDGTLVYHFDGARK